MAEQMLAAYEPDYPVPPTEPAPMQHVPAAPATKEEAGPALRPLLPLAIVTSCLLHAAAAAMLISKAALPEFGVLKNPSDAFSLATTQTIVLESIVTEPVKTAAASAAAMPQGTVQSIDAEPEPLKATKPEVVEKDPPPKVIKTAEVVPETAETSEDPLDVIKGSGEPDETVEAKPAEQKTEETKQHEREQHHKKRRKLAQRQRSKRQIAGGPTARAMSTATAAASGRVSASRGSILSYGARVRARLARNKPPGRGRRGVAKVAFGISTSGDLAYAHLADSSGNAALDQAALAAVRRAAPFGPPPAGASPAQLRFSIPFYFR
jgi:periplasmic protein TonB